MTDEYDYWVEYKSSTSMAWGRYPTGPGINDPAKSYKTPSGYRIDMPFDEEETAIFAIVEHRQKYKHFARVTHRVIGPNGVVWTSDVITETHIWAAQTAAAPITPQEEDMSDITEPLHIPRETLIGRLEERKAEEQAKREEAVAAGKARRQSLLDAVEKLSTDQLANILDRYVAPGNPDAVVKWIDDVVEGSKYVSKDVEAGPVETQLDKTIRVLNMAADKEITVKPNDPIFPLL